jgi:hypothetical protein
MESRPEDGHFHFGFTIRQFGQMALKLSREHLSANHAVRQSDALTLFTNELTLNYQSPLVGHIWQSKAMDWRPALNGPAHGGQSIYGRWLSLSRANLNAGSAPGTGHSGTDLIRQVVGHCLRW